jgi:hypothetical protein
MERPLAMSQRPLSLVGAVCGAPGPVRRLTARSRGRSPKRNPATPSRAGSCIQAPPRPVPGPLSGGARLSAWCVPVRAQGRSEPCAAGSGATHGQAALGVLRGDSAVHGSLAVQVPGRVVGGGVASGLPLGSPRPSPLRQSSSVGTSPPRAQPLPAAGWASRMRWTPRA